MKLPSVEVQEDLLVFPMVGKDGVERDYAIEGCDIETWKTISQLGISIVELAAQRKTNLSDQGANISDDPDETWSMAFGKDTYARMVEDGVRITDMARAFAAVCIWYATGMDHEVALGAWLGKAQPTATLSDRVGVEGSKTNSVSTSTTSRQKKTPPKGQAGKKSGRKRT